MARCRPRPPAVRQGEGQLPLPPRTMLPSVAQENGLISTVTGPAAMVEHLPGRLPGVAVDRADEEEAKLAVSFQMAFFPQ